MCFCFTSLHLRGSTANQYVLSSNWPCFPHPFFRLFHFFFFLFSLTCSRFGRLVSGVKSLGPDRFTKPTLNFSKLWTHVRIYEEVVWSDTTTSTTEIGLKHFGTKLFTPLSSSQLASNLFRFLKELLFLLLIKQKKLLTKVSLKTPPRWLTKSNPRCCSVSCIHRLSATEIWSCLRLSRSGWKS